LDLQTYSALGTICYLLGSIPFGYLLVRLFKNEDIRATGSGNIGATNVARSGARGLAIATLLLDALKGSAAVILAARMIMNADATKEAEAYAAFFVILGHCFPVWLKFRGGKGVATALGAFVLLTPKALGIGLLVFIITVLLSRYVSLGSVLAAVTVPLASYWFDAMSMKALLLLSASCLVVIVKHRQNIGRLIAGTELRFGAKPA
jgi:acyl phosphate:glycerol-3-phosphate acyltransferase